jgi:hypothetical protein
MQELSEVFLSLLVTSGIGLLLAIIKTLYRSKCKIVECCGILKCERDIEHEVELDEREPPSPRPENTNSQRV